MDLRQLKSAESGDAKKMGAAALRTVFNILEKWGCSTEQSQAVLGLARPTYFKLKADPESGRLTRDQLERLSYLLNIHAHLRLVFDNPTNVYGFMRMPNHNPFFNGKSPLDIIASGNFGALYETHKRIDALRGGQW